MAKYNLVWEEIPTKESAPQVNAQPAATLLPMSIKLNASAVKNLMVSDSGVPEKIVLAYDSDKKVIAIKAYDGTPNLKAYDFKEKLSGQGVLIRCKSFMMNVQSAMNLDLSNTKLDCPAHYSGRAKMLVIEVSPNPVAEVEA